MTTLFLDDAWVEPVGTIPYRRNRLVVLVNTPASLHGVSPRGVTSVPRRYINILGEATHLSRTRLHARPKCVLRATAHRVGTENSLSNSRSGGVAT